MLQKISPTTITTTTTTKTCTHFTPVLSTSGQNVSTASGSPSALLNPARRGLKRMLTHSSASCDQNKTASGHPSARDVTCRGGVFLRLDSFEDRPRTCYWYAPPPPPHVRCIARNFQFTSAQQKKKKNRKRRPSDPFALPARLCDQPFRTTNTKVGLAVLYIPRIEKMGKTQT